MHRASFLERFYCTFRPHDRIFLLHNFVSHSIGKKNLRNAFNTMKIPPLQLWSLSLYFTKEESTPKNYQMYCEQATCNTTEYTEWWPCPLFWYFVQYVSIFLLASLVAGRKPQCNAGCRLAGNVLHHTYPLEYQICSCQPRQKSYWANSLRD